MTRSTPTSTETIDASKPRFQLGQVVATPGALSAFERAGQTPAEFLDRHVAGDWGDLTDADRTANDNAVAGGERLMSVYELADGMKIWVITEADRSVTTCLLPEEY